MSKMLITGVGGFIGSKCLEFFKSNYDIFGIDKNYNSGDNFKKGLVNLENLKSFNTEFDIILHFAGSATVAEAEDNPEEERRKTVNSTKDLLEFIRLHNKNAKLIYASSAAVYGNNHSEKIKEANCTEPISKYGKNKLEAEQLCREYSEKYNLDIKVIRFFSVYGEGLKKQVLWDFSNKLKHLEESEIKCFGTGEELRDFTHISDVLNFINIVINQSKSFDIFNCGTGQACKIRNVLLKLTQYYNKNVNLNFENAVHNGNPVSLVANTDKAVSIGYKPKILIDTGLERYAKWFKEEN